MKQGVCLSAPSEMPYPYSSYQVIPAGVVYAIGTDYLTVIQENLSPHAINFRKTSSVWQYSGAGTSGHGLASQLRQANFITTETSATARSGIGRHLYPQTSWGDSLKVHREISVMISFEGSNSSLELPLQGKMDEATSEEPFRELIFYPLLRNEIQRIFRENAGEIFESGMDNEVRTKIRAMLVNYGTQTISALKECLADNRTDVEIISEALRAVGLLDDSRTRKNRLDLLIMALNHSSPIVRDSAALGLSDLGAPETIPYLKNAIRSEPIQSLRDDMIAILEELRDDDHPLTET